MKIFSHIPSWLKNKYLLTGIAFLAILFFFDKNDLFLQIQRRSQLHELNSSEQNLTHLITETRNELNLLKTSAETIEKYARENYLMKKDNEDLFIINPASKSN